LWLCARKQPGLPLFTAHRFVVDVLFGAIL